MSELMLSPPLPGTDEWKSLITASKVPSILGLSRWKSAYTLWHEMKGLIEPEPVDQVRMQMGHLAENYLAESWKYRRQLDHDETWLLNPYDHQRGSYELTYTDPSLPFPNAATVDRRAMNRKVGPGKPGRFWLIEAKTAADLNEWGEEGQLDSVPADYVAQVIWQCGVSGIHQASIVAVNYQMKPEVFDIEYDQELFDGMVSIAEEFYTSLQSDSPPDLDDTVSTYATVRGLNPNIEKGEEVELPEHLAVGYLEAVHEADTAEGKLTGMKSAVLDAMGAAQHATFMGIKVASRRNARGGNVALYANKNAAIE